MYTRATTYQPRRPSLTAGGCPRHVSGLPLLLCTVFVLLLAATAPLRAAENTNDSVLEKRYRIAKAYYHNLQQYHRLGKSRPRWENTVRSFRRIYLARRSAVLQLTED